MNLFNIFSYSNTYPFIIGVSEGGCRPYDTKSHCRNYDSLEVFVNENPDLIELIVYHQRGSHFIKNKNFKFDTLDSFYGRFLEYDLSKIDKVSNYLKKLALQNPVNIIWLGPFLEYRRIPEKEILKETILTVNPESIRLFKALEVPLQISASMNKGYKYLAFNNVFFEPNV